ncbi:MAG TPA: family 16 glycoside hydrolase [Planctomycetota bacterium]|nr:family 16 glycoside hydrolase [Planctomycetota bacterium]
MKRIFCLVGVLLVVGAGTFVQAAGRPATLYTIDGQKLNGTIDEASFGIRTEYGTLEVPTADIEAIYPGFRVGESTRRRIAGLIARLTSANRDSAVRDLTYMGRITVPQLQEAADSSDKLLAKQAKDILKQVWPTGAKVPSDGSGLLRTKQAEYRGTLTFLNVRIEGTFGRKTLLKQGIRLIEFSKGKVQPATDAPTYPPARGGKTPELELTMKDNSRIVGTLDTNSLNVETPYGKLSVPVTDLVSVTLGDPDQIVTREMTFTGKLLTTTLSVNSKVGAFQLDRDKVAVVKAVLDETGTAVVEAGGDLKPNQWTQLFNGKDLKDWGGWGSGSREVDTQTIHLVGDAGVTYQKMSDAKNVIVAARVRINKQTGQGAGIKLCVREGNAGAYFIHFDGRNGAIFKWDNSAKKATQLDAFRADAPVGNWHTVQFGIIENLMLAYVNGKPVAKVTVDPKTALPPGRLSLGVWNCDANFRDIQAKVLD